MKICIDNTVVEFGPSEKNKEKLYIGVGVFTLGESMIKFWRVLIIKNQLTYL